LELIWVGNFKSANEFTNIWGSFLLNSKKVLESSIEQIVYLIVGTNYSKTKNYNFVTDILFTPTFNITSVARFCYLSCIIRPHFWCLH